MRPSRSTAQKRKLPDGWPPPTHLLTCRGMRSTLGPSMRRLGCPSTGESTGCARSTATNPGTTNCAWKPSITVARPCTPTLRTTQGCSSDQQARQRLIHAASRLPQTRGAGTPCRCRGVQQSMCSALLGADSLPEVSTAVRVTSVGPGSRQYVIVLPPPIRPSSEKTPFRYTSYRIRDCGSLSSVDWFQFSQSSGGSVWNENCRFVGGEGGTSSVFAGVVTVSTLLST